MVHNTQNYCVLFGLFPSSGILKTREHNVSETGLVIEVSSFWGTQSNRYLPPPYLRTETGPATETLCFLFSRILDDGLSPKTQ
jgi:hypothetical protein